VDSDGAPIDIVGLVVSMTIEDALLSEPAAPGAASVSSAGKASPGPEIVPKLSEREPVDE
jgi:hypothetical protein